MKRTLIFIAALFFSLAVFAQNAEITIKGKVTDEFDFPLIGAVVYITGTDKGVTTDVNGDYTITVPKKTKELTFSFMGYGSKTVKIDGSKQINVTLEEQVNRLDEALSIGYTSTSKGDAAGALQSVSVKDNETRVVSSTELLLQGKAAGLTIIQNTDQPGVDDFDISIRGMSSIDSNTAPLVIVDGVESSLNRVNTHDIKSITILKDASSAAIYGNRAAGGVIVVETKEGQRGIDIGYNGATSVVLATALPEVVSDPVTYIDLVNEAWYNSANGNMAAPKYSDTERQKWVDRIDKSHTPTDWKNIYYKPGFKHTHHLSASGAGTRYNFSFSTGYQGQKGVVYSAKSDKIDYLLKFSVNFFDKKLQVGANVSGYQSNAHEAQAMTSIINRYLSNRPTIFFKTEKEGQVLYGQGATVYAIEENGGGKNTRYSDLNATFFVNFTPINDLTIKAQYNIRNGSIHTTNFVPQYQLAGSVEVNSITVNRSELTDRSDWSQNHQFTATANYKNKIGRNFRYNLLAGFEMRQRASSYSLTHVYDLSKNAPILAFGDPNTLSSSSNGSEYASMSGFGRASLDYSSRYILELNVRYDGSSKFLKGKRYGWFPSAAFAWRINNEKWLKKVKWVNNLKLRASYGMLGNDNVSNTYTYADRLSPNSYYSFGGTLVNGISYQMFSNPYTTWEKVNQANIGIDFDFLNSFSFSVDVFDKEITDMLCTLKPVPSLGTLENGASMNVGSMRNYGFEISAAWRKMVANSIWVGVGANIGYVHNKILSLGDATEQWHDAAGNVRSAVGYPTRSRFGYDCIGLYQIDDFTWQNDSDPNIPHLQRVYQLKPGRTTTSLHQNPRPGDLLLKDIDGDNNITPNDLVYLGKAKSDLTYSFNLSFTWKYLDFQMLFTGQGKSLTYLQYNAPYSTSFLGQVFTDLQNHRWTEETPQYRCLYADKERLDIVSTYDIYNGAYLRLKNVQLGYTFMGPKLDKAKIKKIQLYVTGENLLTFSHLPKGFDPERSALNSSIISYPIMRSGSLGLSIVF